MNSINLQLFCAKSRGQESYKGMKLLELVGPFAIISMGDGEHSLMICAESRKLSLVFVMESLRCRLFVIVGESS